MNDGRQVRKKEVRKDHHLRFHDWLALLSSPQDILCSSYRVTRFSLVAIAPLPSWHHSLQNQKTEIKPIPWERGGTWDGIKIVLLWFVAEEYYCTFVGTSLHGPSNIAGENVTVSLWNSFNKALSLRPKMCLQLQEQDIDIFVLAKASEGNFYQTEKWLQHAIEKPKTHCCLCRWLSLISQDFPCENTEVP
jgi:hypothetical protein